MFHWKIWEKTLADTLIITKRDEQTIWMAALSGTHATDLRIASASDESTSLVGNIYIGKVRKVQKNIDAAFIEIADRQQCYFNIAANPDAIYTKKGNSKKIAEGDELLIQVIRDGLKTKLPALSGNLELPGRYLRQTFTEHKRTPERMDETICTRKIWLYRAYKRRRSFQRRD